MEKEFIPYTEALALKELGFDEPCFANYSPEFNLYHPEKNYLFNFTELSKTIDILIS